MPRCLHDNQVSVYAKPALPNASVMNPNRGKQLKVEPRSGQSPWSQQRATRPQGKALCNRGTRNIRELLTKGLLTVMPGEDRGCGFR